MEKISKGLDGKLLAFSPAVDNFLTYSLQKNIVSCLRIDYVT